MAGFTDIVSDTDVRFSQATRTTANTQVDNTVSGAIKGVATVVAGGTQLAAEVIVDDAQAGLQNSINTLDERALLGDYTAIKDELGRKYKSTQLNAMKPGTLRDLRILQIQREAMAKHGTSQVGRDIVNTVMKESYGSIAPLAQSRKDQRAIEAAAAADVITQQTNMAETLEAADIYVHRNSDGTYALPRTTQSFMILQGVGVNFKTLTEAGGADGISALGLRDLKGAAKGIEGIYVSTFGKLFSDVANAPDPAARKEALATLYNKATGMSTSLFDGSNPALQAAGVDANTMFGLSTKQRNFVTQEGEAFITDMLGKLGFDSGMASITPGAISDDHLKQVDNMNKMIEAQITANLYGTEMGRALFVVGEWNDNALSKLMTEKLGKIETILLEAGKVPEAAEKSITGTIDFIHTGEGEGDAAVAASLIVDGMFNESDADDPEMVERWSRAMTLVVKDGFTEVSKDSRDAVFQALDSSKSLDFFKALPNGKEAANIFNWYATEKIDIQTKSLESILKYSETGSISMSMSGKLWSYNGDKQDIKTSVENLNRSIEKFERFKGIVPKNSIPDQTNLSDLFNGYSKPDEIVEQETMDTIIDLTIEPGSFGQGGS